MAQIGHGYGSEWQLLRMLGHHREYFFRELRKQLPLSTDTEIHWLDYPFDDSSKPGISGDKEFKKGEFFEKIPEIFTPEIVLDLEKDKFGAKLNQHWDGIFWIGKTVYLVEAKAYAKEMISDCQSDNKNSLAVIEQYFKETREYFGISSDNDWKKTYYQMANRVAFLKLLNSHGVDAKLVNIYFIDGYEKRIKDLDSDIIQNKNTSQEEWERAIMEEENYLGISRLKNLMIFPVFVNCKKYE